MPPYQTIDIPLGGLNTKPDDYLLDPPGLSVLQDGQFEDLGGIQTREQYQAILDAAGNTIADIRKIAAYGDELVAFSKDKLWSYASGDGLWTERADYLAVKLNEAPRFVTTGDQYDCDRAELGGVTMYCWMETTPSGSRCYVAAIDTATGAVKLSPTVLDVGQERPRLIAGSTRIFFIRWENGAEELVIRTYDPADLSYQETNQGTVGLTSFDVVVDPNDNSMVLVVCALATTYSFFRFDEDAVLDGSTSRTVTVSGAIALAARGNDVAIVYNNGTAVRADIITVEPLSVGGLLVQVAVNIAVGTASSATVNQVTVAHDGTEFHAFWSAAENTSFVAFQTEHNTFSNAGTPGTESTVVRNLGIVTRAFVHDSQVYLWLAFSGVSTGALTAQLQNSYFLYRSDGLLVAKGVAMTAGGFSSTQGRLSGVQNTSGNIWSWCGSQRRIIPLGQDQKGYSAKSPHEVSAEFDSNEARRTAMLGDTLYISGGQLSQYDGANVTEVAFHMFPWFLGIGTGDPGNLNGTYNFLSSFAWYNAKGEFERSTTATIDSEPMVNDKATTVASLLWATAKTGAAGEVAIEFWRQVADAPVGAPFYLVTSKDPASTGDNAYQENDITGGASQGLIDNISDANLISRETWPENGGMTLENLAPTAASIILATQDRLLLAGIPGNPHRLVYSKLRGQGEIASFHDLLYVDLPPDGGPITAIGFLNETLIAFKESAVYALPGDGYDNNGGGQNYGPGRLLSSDVGAETMDSVVLTPRGLLFRSLKGWYLLTQGWDAVYVGGPVEEFDSDTVLSAHVIETQHQVRIVTDARILVWNYLANPADQSGQWSEWPIVTTAACMWDGKHTVVNSDGDSVMQQDGTHSGVGDLPALDVETGWLKTGGLQGYGLVRRLLVLGKYLGAHDLRVRVAYDYNTDWIDDKTWTVSPTTANDPLQVEHGLSRPKCQSVKFRITAQAVGNETAPTTQALNITGLSLEIKQKNSHFGKAMGAAQKQ